MLASAAHQKASAPKPRLSEKVLPGMTGSKMQAP
jgi:hypothetical protein